ncbi:MAG: ABC transporter ATP-binding protein [Gammaproteobacteria bacterium]|nr:ABC transporter ATP-binding protein [Gammaproteobacteria bacterium]
MSEGATVESGRGLASFGRDARFDDRIDLATNITNIQALWLIGRALVLLRNVKALFAGKMVLAALALIPGLTLPFLAKITIDQVILGKSFEDIEIPFPPHIVPFVDAVSGLGQMEIMLAVIAFSAVLLFLFGRGGLFVWIGGGADSASTSELKLNAGSSAASGVFGVVETWINIRLTQRLANGLRTRLFNRLAQLPMSRLDDHRIGDSVYRVMYDAPDVPEISLGLTLEPIFTLIGVVVTLYLLQYSYDQALPNLVWVAGLLVPAGLLATLPASGLIRRVQQASRAAGTATTNAIEESMSNIAAVQSLGGMARDKERIEAKSDESYRRYRHVVLMQIAMWALSTLLTLGLGIYVAVSVLGGIIEESMTPGDFGAVFGFALSIGGAGLAIGMAWINLQGNTAAIRRVFFFLDMDAEDAFERMPGLSPVRQGVRFENVDFDYPNGQVALRGVDLDLRLGELVAVVGPTGAGKTSLAYLIPGFYRPTRGRVLVDGEDIHRVNLASLRRQVSYVFQEHLLMSESIGSNLLLVNPSASESDMRAACRTAGALEFIDALPEGFDTVLGRSGDTLSVGQKQRLCIARGLIRDTPILILDEPTAALDPATEHALVRSLREATEGRLVVVIAHRLSTIRRADRIVFLEDGEVRGIGSHDDLMADPESRYRRFVELQGGAQR